MTTADTIKKILDEKKISKYRLAKTLGVTWATLQLWIKGAFLPNKSNQKKIKKYLDNT